MYGVRNLSVNLSIPALKSLAGKRLTVVGGTSGVGRALAFNAAKIGADVTIVGRSFRDPSPPANIKFVASDLSLMKNAQTLGRALEPADVFVFTTGIVPQKIREETEEGLEKDMATSCLSRLVILRELAPKLVAGNRIFVYGMPGNGAVFPRKDDLNAEKHYEGGFGFVHMNTVGGNEALVLALAARAKASGLGVSYFGLNPGLLPTGLRDAMHGGNSSFLGSLLEKGLALFTPTLESYAATTVPLLFAPPELDVHSGSMFGQKGHAILSNKEFSEDPSNVDKWYTAMEQLVKSKARI